LPSTRSLVNTVGAKVSKTRIKIDAGIQCILESLVDASIRRIVPPLKNVMFEKLADDAGLSCHLRVLGTTDDVHYQYIMDEQGNPITCSRLRHDIDEYARRDGFDIKEQEYLDTLIDLMHFPLDSSL
jgi:hypothetical protein